MHKKSGDTAVPIHIDFFLDKHPLLARLNIFRIAAFPFFCVAITTSNTHRYQFTFQVHQML